MNFGIFVRKFIRNLQPLTIIVIVPLVKKLDIIVHVSVAISARSLYNKCKETALKALKEEDIPSLSCFCFQFWLKDSWMHTALNYTGRFKIKYMMQKHMIWKQHDDDCYCACLYKYLRSMAVQKVTYPISFVQMINIKFQLVTWVSPISST